MREYIEIGKIVNTHGVAGAVKVEPWCDSVEVLCGIKRLYTEEKNGEYREIAVLSASAHKGHALMKLNGIDNLDKAMLLKTKVVFASREDIPIEEGAFLVDDLKGLSVTDINTGVKYGILSDVIQGAAGDIYEVTTENGAVLVPAVKEFIKEIDLDKGVLIAPIGGMFDEI